MSRRKIVSMLALFAAFAGTSMALPGRGSVSAIATEAEATVAPLQEQALASTIQIEMQGDSRIEAGLKRVLTARGLGTLVQYGGQRFIITHNHWSLLPGKLERVELRSAFNELLLILDSRTFLSLKRYQDWGTMVLAAPQELQGVEPATLGDGASLVAGTAVQVASQAAGGDSPVGVATAWIEKVDVASAPGLLELHRSDAAVVAGDSGGGIWYDGQLVGNLWAITVAPAHWPWEKWFSGPERPTGTILVVIQPLDSSSGLVASDLAPEPAQDMGYERGPQKVFEE